MKFPERQFWWKCRLTLWGVDLLSSFILVGAFVAIEVNLNPSRNTWVFGVRLIVQTAMIWTIVKFPPSRLILPRWSRAFEASRRRNRLKDWRDLNGSSASPGLQREAWFMKPK